ncbi:hypothetical protein PAHAL_2G094700 [Panicum hallii]|uniref:Secreted protein n=1 Tax=Panicum hallii TaxID=206008 RepID=A0A2T8KNH5_9POAL|nr:hypothetical protein PAHAL_2G094700 [Panicum hallii]
MHYVRCSQKSQVVLIFAFFCVLSLCIQTSPGRAQIRRWSLHICVRPGQYYSHQRITVVRESSNLSMF